MVGARGWWGMGGVGRQRSRIPTVDPCVYGIQRRSGVRRQRWCGAAAADVVVDDGRIVDIGLGLDGDAAVDCSGRTIVPGFIDSHVHFMSDGNLDPMSSVVTPFSLNFYLAAERMVRTLAAGVDDRPRGRADRIRASRRRRRAAFVAGPLHVDLDHDPEPDRRTRRPVAGAAPTSPVSWASPTRASEQRRRRAGGDAAATAADPAGADVIKVCMLGRRAVAARRSAARTLCDEELDVLVAGRWAAASG